MAKLCVNPDCGHIKGLHKPKTGNPLNPGGCYAITGHSMAGREIRCECEGYQPP
jgi:hypothetical protein